MCFFFSQVNEGFFSFFLSLLTLSTTLVLIWPEKMASLFGPGLTFCFLICPRLVQEAEDILGSRQHVSYDDLSKLNYTDLVMKETLRLHPSVPAFTRVMAKDDELDGHQIPAGTLLNIGVYALHHNPKYWNDPEKFDPERFSREDEHAAGHSHYAYIPFSLGPRHCIGQMFAEFETKVLMSRFLKSFKFKLVPGQEYGYEEPKSTLTPKNRMCCTLTLR